MSFQYCGGRNSYAGLAPSRDFGAHTSARRDWQYSLSTGYQAYKKPSYERMSVDNGELNSADIIKELAERSKQVNFSKMEVSKTRQKIRDLICRSKNDPRYFDY